MVNREVKYECFYNSPLDLKNQFTDDPLLKNLINEKIKSKYLHEITEDLTRFGEEGYHKNFKDSRASRE